MQKESGKWEKTNLVGREDREVCVDVLGEVAEA